MKKIHAAIEAGGTKWICAVGDHQGNVFEECVIDTQSPQQTLNDVIQGLTQLQQTHGEIGSLGIGSFGPIGLNPSSKDYGTFINTPKVGWSDFNILTPIQNAFKNQFDIYLDTDVNTAVYAESQLGVAKGLNNICYITVGTGIGGGVMIDGKILKGRMHPEMGHMPVQTLPQEPNANFSACPFHSNCVEGKASGTAMKARWQTTPDKFPALAWELEADYLAQLAVSLTAAYSPDIIIFGGGVSKKEHLIEKIREKFESRQGGYWRLPSLEEYIVPTSFSDRAGLVGAFLLAPNVK